MKCKKEGCDGTLGMAFLTKRGSNTITPSFIYACDKCSTIYLMVPHTVDPQLIEDGRDQVLLYLEEQLGIAEHALANYVEPERSLLYKIFNTGEDLAYARLEHNSRHIRGLIRTRKREAEGWLNKKRT